MKVVHLLTLFSLIVFFFGNIKATQVHFRSGILDTEAQVELSAQSYLQDKLERSRYALNDLLSFLNVPQTKHSSPSSSSDFNLDTLVSELFLYPKSNSWEHQKDHQVLVLMELESPIVREELMNRYGLETMKYVGGDRVYLTRLSLDLLSREFSDSTKNEEKGIKWIGHYSKDFKSTFNFGSSSSTFSNMKTKEIINNNHNSIEPLKFTVVLKGSSVQDKLQNERIENHLNRIFAQSDFRATVKFESHRRASFECQHSSVANKIIPVLAEMENVVWIELSTPKKLNNQFSHVIMQTGTNQNVTLGNTPIWNQDIRGDGEIVTVLDSGLDWDNCFFADPSGNDPPSDNVDKSLRKVIGYYRTGSDVITSDGVNGHGTHVTGTVAGSIMNSESNYDELHQFNGMAPDAKIIMQGSENNQGGLSIPDDLSNLIQIAKSSESYIHTNSWGSAWSSLIDCEFDCQCVWGPAAAAIDGIEPGEPVDDNTCETELGGPCCYVGAVYNSASENIDDVLYENDEMVMLFAASNEGSISSKSSISNQATSKNAIAVGSSNTAVQNFAESYKYVDLLQYADINGYDSVSECCDAESVCCESYWQNRYTDQERYQPNAVTFFSSRGPTLDGRIRPDIVAPGHVVLSTHSDGDTTTNQCGTGSPRLGNDAAILSMSGTSMATPGVAGAAALVREYFTKGFYPSGSKNSDDSKMPSGMLVKAMIVHSGSRTITRTVDGNSEPITIDSTPNRYSGYGLVDLSSVLKFSDSNFDLAVFDDLSLSEGQRDVWKFTASASGDVKVTLTWYDPPGNPSSSSAMVNQLNLGIGEDSIESKDVTKQLSASVSQDDSIEIYVDAARVREGPQKYAIVFTYPQGELDAPQREGSISDSSDARVNARYSLSVIMLSTGFIAFVVPSLLF